MPQPTRSEIETGVKSGRAFEHSDLRDVQLEGAMLVGIKLARADLDGANLANADLSGADLAGATLREAFLAGAKLADAGLAKADLDGANLKGADLSGADLTRANLSGANLEAANLQGARLRYAQLDAAVLGRANLTGAILCHADLEEADLGGANVRGANLERANLRGTNLEHACLEGASLERAFCQGARFVGAIAKDARMQEADLGGARMKDCDLSGADLRFTVFGDADLQNAVLTGAKVHGIELAKLPQSVVVEWADGSPNADGSCLLDARQVRRLVADEPTVVEVPTRRFLGEGDVLRHAELDFAESAEVHIESELVGCTIRLSPDAELVLGERGIMRDCTVVGGRLTIHGRFFEGGRTGLRDPRSVVVSRTGVLATRILQVPQSTQFAFERGCRLRLDISGADPIEHNTGKRNIMADSEKKTYVEEGTEFVGTLRAKCPVVVKGSLEGDLEAPAVSVTSTGKVTGNVKAKRVESEGVLAGSIDADEISLAGSVKSNTVIRARSLEVKLGAEKGKLEVTFGECIVEVGDMPSAEERAESTKEEPAKVAAESDDTSKRARKRKGDGDATEDSGESAKIGPNGADPHPLV